MRLPLGRHARLERAGTLGSGRRALVLLTPPRGLSRLRRQRARSASLAFVLVLHRGELAALFCGRELVFRHAAVAVGVGHADARPFLVADLVGRERAVVIGVFLLEHAAAHLVAAHALAAVCGEAELARRER